MREHQNLQSQRSLVVQKTFEADCLGGAFDFHPLLTLPIVQDRKWIKKASLFERSEFRSFPIFCLAQLGTRRAVAAWSPFFAYFLWRSKESKWLSGHSRPTTRNAIPRPIISLEITPSTTPNSNRNSSTIQSKLAHPHPIKQIHHQQLRHRTHTRH
jgi:hypothetical protein